VKKEILALT